MEYCNDALRLLRIKVVCGKGCPILDECPRLIMEDASAEMIEKAMRAFVKVKYKDGKKNEG